MRLHGFWRSIATYRVRVALNLKGIAYEEVDHDLMAGDQCRPDYLALNPMGAVPALETDGRVLTQSIAILDYLDSLEGGPRLWPVEPFERARAIAFAMNIISDTHPLFVPRVRKELATRFAADDTAVKAWAGHWLQAGLTAFEALLTARPPAPFVMGDTVGGADIAFAGHFVGHYSPNMDRAPICKKLVERLLAMPEFEAAHPQNRRPRT